MHGASESKKSKAHLPRNAMPGRILNPSKLLRARPFQKPMSQSAMEYLMTYGWSLLIIALALVALFELGAFNGFGGASSCIAQSGYLCTNIWANANTASGNHAGGEPSITVTIGQATGQTWSNVYIISAPQGITINDNNINPGLSCTSCFMYWGSIYGLRNFTASLASGQQKTVQFWVDYNDPGMSGPTGAIGERFTGTMWAMYSVPGATNAITEIGIYVVTATTNTIPN